jgi:hypothetical protein
MRYKVRTLQRKRDHRASAVSVGRWWEMNHSSRWLSGTPRTISERPDTGGLTVAALVNMRLCIADGAILRPGIASCAKSGRREPTVGNFHARTGVG